MILHSRYHMAEAHMISENQVWCLDHRRHHLKYLHLIDTIPVAASFLCHMSQDTVRRQLVIKLKISN